MDGWIDRLLLNSLCCFIFLLTLFHFFLSLPFLFILPSFSTFPSDSRFLTQPSPFASLSPISLTNHLSSSLFSACPVSLSFAPPPLSSFLTNCPPVVSSPRPLHFFRLVSSPLLYPSPLLPYLHLCSSSSSPPRVLSPLFCPLLCSPLSYSLLCFQ